MMQKKFSACLEKQKKLGETPNLEGVKTNFPKVVIIKHSPEANTQMLVFFSKIKSFR